MHSLLKRQLKRFLGEEKNWPGTFLEFINAVDEAYDQFDQNRRLTERSMELSSQELVEANADMKGMLTKYEKSVSLLRATLDSTNDGILVVDEEGRISDFNLKFVELWRIPLPVLEAKDDAKALQFVLNELKDPDAFVSKVMELYGKPEATSFDVLEFKDGRVFERYSQAQFMSGKSVGRVWSFRDVTEQRKLQAMVHQSEKMSAMGQLAGGVAHEINNPLGVILGFAQSLKSHLKDNDPSLAALDHIEREATRCKNLVQNLLTFSRTSRAEDKGLMCVNEAINDAFSLIEAHSKFNTIDLSKNLQEDLPKILGNKTQIQQIVINLCNNAIDAMNHQGTLTVKTFAVGQNGSSAVALEVTDTGQGMSEEIQKKIFEPFFTTKEVGKGTGLGLALVYEIVQKHKGKINVKSRVGEGTMFTVTLPVENRVHDGKNPLM